MLSAPKIGGSSDLERRWESQPGMLVGDRVTKKNQSVKDGVSFPNCKNPCFFLRRESPTNPSYLLPTETVGTRLLCCFFSPTVVSPSQMLLFPFSNLWYLPPARLWYLWQAWFRFLGSYRYGECFSTAAIVLLGVESEREWGFWIGESRGQSCVNVPAIFSHWYIAYCC